MIEHLFDTPSLAGAWLANGNILAYPTESVWGLGCNAFCEEAVQELLTLKNRPMDKGLIVLTADVSFIKEFLQDLPDERQQDIRTSWQHPAQTQATTWLFDIPPNLPKPIAHWITGAHDSLAIRVINHPTIKKLCEFIASSPAFGNPYGFLVSTSCNPNGQAPATTLEEARVYFATHPKVAFLRAQTLGLTAPSQIRHASTGVYIRF